MTAEVGVELAIEVLRSGRPVELLVGGMSMWPLLRSGSTVRIEPGLPGEVGAVVAIERNGRIVVHRVVELRAAGLLLRGDNLPEDDPLVPVEALLGRVTTVRGRDGTLVDLMRRRWRAGGRLVVEVARRTRGPWRLARAAARGWRRWRQA